MVRIHLISYIYTRERLASLDQLSSYTDERQNDNGSRDVTWERCHLTSSNPVMFLHEGS